jgi:predicted alpha/beta-hydrolase family hydrolase
VPGLVVDPGAPPGEGVPVLLTHGAGGDVHGAGLAALAEGLAALGHTVVRFNLPYREAGRSSPPPAE